MSLFDDINNCHDDIINSCSYRIERLDILKFLKEYYMQRYYTISCKSVDENRYKAQFNYKFELYDWIIEFYPDNFLIKKISVELHNLYHIDRTYITLFLNELYDKKKLIVDLVEFQNKNNTRVLIGGKEQTLSSDFVYNGLPKVTLHDSEDYLSCISMVNFVFETPADKEYFYEFYNLPDNDAKYIDRRLLCWML